MAVELLRMVLREGPSLETSSPQFSTVESDWSTMRLADLLAQLRDSSRQMSQARSLLTQTLLAIEERLADLKMELDFWLDEYADCALLREKTILKPEPGNGGTRASMAFNVVYLGFTKIDHRWRLAVRYKVEHAESSETLQSDAVPVSEDALTESDFRIQHAALQKMPEFVLHLNDRAAELVSIIGDAAKDILPNQNSDSKLAV